MYRRSGPAIFFVLTVTSVASEACLLLLADLYPLAVLSHLGLVKAETQSRRLMQDHVAVAVFQLTIDQTAEVQHLIVPEKFHIARIRRRRHQRRVHVMEPVRAHDLAVARRRRRDAPPFGNVAADHGIGLQNCSTVLVQQLLVIPTAVTDFTGGDRYAGEFG